MVEELWGKLFKEAAEVKQITEEYDIESLLKEFNRIIAEPQGRSGYSIQFCNERNQCIPTAMSFSEHAVIAFEFGKELYEITEEDEKRWEQFHHASKEFSAAALAEQEITKHKMRETVIANSIRLLQERIKKTQQSIKSLDKFKISESK